MRTGKKIINLPKPLKKIASASLALVENNSLVEKRYQLRSRIKKTRHLLKNPTYYEVLMSVTQEFTPEALQQVFINDISVLTSDYERNDIKKEYYDPLSYMMAVDYQTYLADDILQKVDRATMAVSLEGREPFLDHHVIEWAAKLPTHFKYRNGIKKYLLKQIVHQYIPKEILNQPKSGFGIPKVQWLKKELKNYVDTYLDKTLIKSQGIFDINVINNIKQEFEKGNTLYADKIWKLLMFQMWYKAWMD
jgi:asparagine synthase (glutamine-hydrolysing)